MPPPPAGPARLPLLGMPEDDFRPSASMVDMVVNAAVRLVFLLGEAKDEEMGTQHAYALTLAGEAIRLWPAVGAQDAAAQVPGCFWC